jgi:hypothetical protein
MELDTSGVGGDDGERAAAHEERSREKRRKVGATPLVSSVSPHLVCSSLPLNRRRRSVVVAALEDVVAAVAATAHERRRAHGASLVASSGKQEQITTRILFRVFVWTGGVVVGSDWLGCRYASVARREGAVPLCASYCRRGGGETWSQELL